MFNKLIATMCEVSDYSCCYLCLASNGTHCAANIAQQCAAITQFPAGPPCQRRGTMPSLHAMKKLNNRGKHPPKATLLQVARRVLFFRSPFWLTYHIMKTGVRWQFGISNKRKTVNHTGLVISCQMYALLIVHITCTISNHSCGHVDFKVFPVS